jgi:hypothetical protein
MSDPAPSAESFEREKWQADVRLRERELDLRDRQVQADIIERRRTRWTNPLVLAVLAAALAAGGNAAVALINGILQRSLEDSRSTAQNKLEKEKADAQQALEESKAEAARILEVIKTNDPDKAATNLRFLLDTGMIGSENRRRDLSAFLKARPQGQGPALAAPGPFTPTVTTLPRAPRVSDPTKTGFLAQANALQNYGEKVLRLVQLFHATHAVPNSGFVQREAFEELVGGTQAITAAFRWKAFPVTASAGPEQIDNGRFQLQDEYVEWRAEKQGGALTRVTFTTELCEYFEALAEAGTARLKEEIGRLVPGANPTDQELFGTGFDPATATPAARGNRFVRHLRRNPWNNGERGILCLTHGSNTMGALFGVLSACSVPRLDLRSGDVCAKVGDSCVPGRNSDPSVCGAAQEVARNGSFSLQDPVGIRIISLDPAGRWTVDGEAVDMNNEAANGGIWKVTRNGRRGTFTFQGDVRLGGAKITTGADLSRQLIVGVDVIHAPNAAMPEWARRGK